MKHFLVLCFIVFSSWSSHAQRLLLHSSQLDTIGLDSSGFRQNRMAVGQVNYRFPATLIDSSGLVLVAREALETVLPMVTDTGVQYYSAPLPLKNVVVSFPIKATEITGRILDKAIQRQEYEVQMQSIQRKISLVLIDTSLNGPGRKTVRRYDYQNRFFLHYYLDFTEVKLLAQSNFSEGGNYAILRILGDSPYPLPPQNSTQDSLGQAAYAINYPAKTYYRSSPTALSLFLSALEHSLKVLKPAMEVYQSFRRLPPKKLAEFYELQASTYQYLQETAAMEAKKSRENQLIIHPELLSIKREAEQVSNNLQPLHQQYYLSQALSQSIKLLQLTQYIDNRIQRGYTQAAPVVSYLEDWQQDWNLTIDQTLFAQLLSLYFDQSRAQYFSKDLIEQIRANNKSFEALASQIYQESLLAQPQEMLRLIEAEGTSALFFQLEKDIGYLFCSRLLADQQERVYRPYRKAIPEWNAIENRWLSTTAELEHPAFLDANSSQRLHWLGTSGTAALPAWKDNMGSPLFNADHHLIGFAFPEYSFQPGVEWHLPQQPSPHIIRSIKEIMKVTSTIKH